MGMGQFWVPGSAVGHKWSNFQPFGFKFGLYSLLLGSSTWKTKKYQFGANLCPFRGTDPFRGAQITWYHNFSSGCPFDLKFARFLFGYDI